MIEARDLVSQDILSQDPYVNLTLQGALNKVTGRTQVIKGGGTTPFWDEQFLFDIVDHYELECVVMDKDIITADDEVAQVTIELAEIFRLGTRQSWVPMVLRNSWGGEIGGGDLHVRAAFQGPPGIAFPQLRSEMPSYDERSRKLAPRRKSLELSALRSKGSLADHMGVAVEGEEKDKEGQKERQKADEEERREAMRRQQEEQELEQQGRPPSQEASPRSKRSPGKLQAGLQQVVQDGAIRQQQLAEEGEGDDLSTLGDEDGESAPGDEEEEGEEGMPNSDEDADDVFTDEQIEEAFSAIDLDNNDYIGPLELKHMLVCMGELVTDQEIDMMVKMCDLDGDGQISLAEFTAVARFPGKDAHDWQEFNAQAVARKYSITVDADKRERRLSTTSKRSGNGAASVGGRSAGPAGSAGLSSRRMSAVSVGSTFTSATKLVADLEKEQARKSRKWDAGEVFMTVHQLRLPELRRVFDKARDRPFFLRYGGMVTFAELFALLDLRPIAGEIEDLFDAFSLSPDQQNKELEVKRRQEAISLAQEKKKTGLTSAAAAAAGEPGTNGSAAAEGAGDGTGSSKLPDVRLAKDAGTVTRADLRGVLLSLIAFLNSTKEQKVS